MSTRINVEISSRQFLNNVLSDLTNGDPSLVSDGIIKFTRDWLTRNGGRDRQSYPVSMQQDFLREFYGR